MCTPRARAGTSNGSAYSRSMRSRTRRRSARSRSRSSRRCPLPPAIARCCHVPRTVPRPVRLIHRPAGSPASTPAGYRRGSRLEGVLARLSRSGASQAAGLDLVSGRPAPAAGEEPTPQRSLDGHHGALREPPGDSAGAGGPTGDVDGVDPSTAGPALAARDHDPEVRDHVATGQLALHHLATEPTHEGDSVVAQRQLLLVHLSPFPVPGWRGRRAGAPAGPGPVDTGVRTGPWGAVQVALRPRLLPRTALRWTRPQGKGRVRRAGAATRHGGACLPPRSTPQRPTRGVARSSTDSLGSVRSTVMRPAGRPSRCQCEPRRTSWRVPPRSPAPSAASTSTPCGCSPWIQPAWLPCSPPSCSTCHPSRRAAGCAPRRWSSSRHRCTPWARGPHSSWRSPAMTGAIVAAANVPGAGRCWTPRRNADLPCVALSRWAPLARASCTTSRPEGYVTTSRPEGYVTTSRPEGYVTTSRPEGYVAGGEASSIATSVWASGSHRPAATFARTCSGVRAPAITEATPGWAARPPRASVSSDTPACSATRSSASIRSKSAAARRSGRLARRVPSGAGAPLRYLPVSRPEANG